MKPLIDDIVKSLQQLRDSDTHVCPYDEWQKSDETGEEPICSCLKYDELIDKVQALNKTTENKETIKSLTASILDNIKYVNNNLDELSDSELGDLGHLLDKVDDYAEKSAAWVMNIQNENDEKK